MFAATFVEQWAGNLCLHAVLMLLALGYLFGKTTKALQNSEPARGAAKSLANTGVQILLGKLFKK